jgi:hypothetical protein
MQYGDKTEALMQRRNFCFTQAFFRVLSHGVNIARESARGTEFGGSQSDCSGDNNVSERA